MNGVFYKNQQNGSKLLSSF